MQEENKPEENQIQDNSLRIKELKKEIKILNTELKTLTK